MSAEDDDEVKKDNGGGGAPGWMATFADLMSLLLTFFILLLSFAEMQVPKFKIVAGSLRNAFGVQREEIFEPPPRGTSFVSDEFSPGKPEIISFIDSPEMTITDPILEEVKKSREELLKKQFQDDVDTVVRGLKSEIESGDVEIETKGKDIVIRLHETITFDSGSSALKKQFAQTLTKMAKIVNDVDGSITVAGHTDNIPISSKRYRSNWELSSSRAVSLGHSLLKVAKLSPERLIIQGHADTKPIKPNTTPVNRSKNRRVEVIISTEPDESQISQQLNQIIKSKKASAQQKNESLKAADPNLSNNPISN